MQRDGNFISRHYLSNKKAKFNEPVDKKGNKTQFKEGSHIYIEISGPMNDGYVKVKSIKESSKKLSAQFVTMEGHMEKGMINFNLSKTEDGIKFSIDSKSEVDYGMVPEDFARSKQKESWKQVLDNVVEKTGGEEAERNVEISDPDSN